MLRAVELFGFKSFADRTRLEFDAGICAIVGPNGSGKSNIVDAIKWVLGEQSYKKLRAAESTDVIFNGSQGRAPLGSAEVTLTFDNSKKTFNLETPEVHITRRIYRSGEGEYLINRQAVRLKDVKDLLNGTGLGTQAYSIIEQGRVESLLQSSSVQRRTLFEEAAGINRFNTQKQELQHKWERINQNLVRCTDYIREKEFQLRTARSQAGNAQLYREYSARLQELRIKAALKDYRKYTAQEQSLSGEVEELNAAADRLTFELKEREQAVETLNGDIDNADRTIRRFEGQTAAVRQQITGSQSTIELQTVQANELETEIADNTRQLLELNDRSSDNEAVRHQAAAELHTARRTAQEIQSEYQKLLALENEFDTVRKDKRNEKERLRKEFEAQNQEKAKLDGSFSGWETQLTAQKNTRAEYVARREVAEANHQENETEYIQLCQAVERFQDVALQKYGQLEEAKERKSERMRQLAQLSVQLSEQKQKQSGMKERMSLLEDLIRKHEGLNQGIKDVLRQSKDKNSPFKHSFGLVADLLNVATPNALLIELALGSSAQLIVVAPNKELFRYIEENPAQFSGRVGFIWFDKKNPVLPDDGRFLNRLGVVGRADQFVQTQPEFRSLSQRLLGKTWIVENIAVARKLYKESDAQTKFLTVSGEMLTPDGALIVGPLNMSNGLITRRSELRTLNETMLELDAAVTGLEKDVADAKKLAAEDDIDVEDETKEHQKAVEKLDAKRLELSAAQERQRQGSERIKHLNEEIEKLDTQITKTAEDLNQAAIKRLKFNEQLTVLENRQIENQQEQERAETDYAQHQQETNDKKIELAKSEERLRSLEERLLQFEEQWKERQKTLAQHRKRNKTLKERLETIWLSVLQQESALAERYLQKETLVMESAAADQKRNELNHKRTKIQSEFKKRNKEFNQAQNKAHTKQNELERCRQEQRLIVERFQEDYAVDIAADIKRYDDDTQGNAADDAVLAANERNEIDDLRIKLQKIGNVNLGAIEQVEELENTYTKALGEYNDLLNSKQNYERICEQVDVSRKQLFEETFEGVRLHFRELFQHLFGGGNADLVLENPDNMLESGVDIIAKPPGKDLKNIMLLSGGEKTMTCVALLLAFFRYRPNPVCILDECDAALDEGNIDRFANVVKNFRTNTQFLMITHSKKTMASATTIYGVTMQESGVSKPVSVRFVDVDENGNLLDRAA